MKNKKNTELDPDSLRACADWIEQNWNHAAADRMAKELGLVQPARVPDPWEDPRGACEALFDSRTRDKAREMVIDRIRSEYGEGMAEFARVVVDRLTGDAKPDPVEKKPAKKRNVDPFNKGQLDDWVYERLHYTVIGFTKGELLAALKGSMLYCASMSHAAAPAARELGQSLQRLRKRGVIEFVPNLGWRLIDSVSVEKKPPEKKNVDPYRNDELDDWVLSYLSAHGGSCERGFLADQLWYDVDPNCRVYEDLGPAIGRSLQRLRSQRPGSIEHLPSGWRLIDSASVEKKPPEKKAVGSIKCANPFDPDELDGWVLSQFSDGIGYIFKSELLEDLKDGVYRYLAALHYDLSYALGQSLQRLRKRGVIEFGPDLGWRLS